MNRTETKIKKLISEAAGLCYQVNATTTHGACLRVSGCTGNIEITFYNVKSDGLDSGKTGEWVRLFDDFVQVKGSFSINTNAELIHNFQEAIAFLKAKLQEAQND